LGSRSSAAQLEGLRILDGDLRLVNLEGPITDRAHEEKEKFAAASFVKEWLRGKIDVVTLANNHALDQGPEGRDDTARSLNSVGITSVVSREKVKGVTFLARDYPPSSELDDEKLIEEVRRADKPVIVSLHWGHTGSLLPSPEQRAFADKLVDAGATAILGHGPHTLQGIERRGKSVIAYSLGNFAFSCDCTDVNDAYVLRFRIRENGVENLEVIPIRAGLKGEIPKRSEDPGLRQLIDELSRDLATRPGG
jgi:poly-gamma-glutamate synthesis protein (capsule biosynthesis protein)